jgi:hypothetical protein
VRRRKFLLGTTDSRHGLPIYPNVAAGMVLTSIDQLWVADITYIRLQWEFVYSARKSSGVSIALPGRSLVAAVPRFQ